MSLLFSDETGYVSTATMEEDECTDDPGNDLLSAASMNVSVMAVVPV
jgi:hypothetical protein